jgi:PBSX family phage terminase large subunit
MTTTLVEHVYEPRGTAARLFAMRDDEILISGAAGTGKSRACLEKLNAVALKYAGMKGLIARKTLASLGSSALDTWRRFVITELELVGECWFYGGSSEEPPQYRYANGSSIVIGGMDKPSKIMSTEYDIAYVQEATELTDKDWEAITTRLRRGHMPYNQLIADCNPDGPFHWLKLRCDEGKTTILNARHEENPIYFDDAGTVTQQGAAYMKKLNRLTGVRKKRLKDGLWVAAEGSIYEEWDDNVHLVDEFEVPTDWPRYWSIDWGVTNPFVCQMWAEDEDGRAYLYREFYMTGKPAEDHAHEIMSVVAPGGKWIEPKPQAVICDHDPGDRTVFTRITGLPTRAAKKEVSIGIQRVQSRLKKAADGRPRLFICRNALVRKDPELVEAIKPYCTHQEISGYVWKKGPDGKPVPEDPEKKNDHGMDAKRYYVMDRDHKAQYEYRRV